MRIRCILPVLLILLLSVPAFAGEGRAISFGLFAGLYGGAGSESISDFENFHPGGMIVSFGLNYYIQ